MKETTSTTLAEAVLSILREHLYHQIDMKDNLYDAYCKTCNKSIFFRLRRPRNESKPS